MKNASYCVSYGKERRLQQNELKSSFCYSPFFPPLFSASSDAVVEVGDEGVDVDAVGTSALADGFEVSSHAANAAETVLLEDFNDLRIFLNGFNDTRVFCNLCHYVYSSL